MNKLKEWWTDACRPWRDRFQNILEDWTGNAIFAGVACFVFWLSQYFPRIF